MDAQQGLIALGTLLAISVVALGALFLSLRKRVTRLQYEMAGVRCAASPGPVKHHPPGDPGPPPPYPVLPETVRDPRRYAETAELAKVDIPESERRRRDAVPYDGPLPPIPPSQRERQAVALAAGGMAVYGTDDEEEDVTEGWGKRRVATTLPVIPALPPVPGSQRRPTGRESDVGPLGAAPVADEPGDESVDRPRDTWPTEPPQAS